MKVLKQRRDTGTWAFYRRREGVLEHSLVVPFSLKPDGVGTIGKSAQRATILRGAPIAVTRCSAQA